MAQWWTDSSKVPRPHHLYAPRRPSSRLVPLILTLLGSVMLPVNSGGHKSIRLALQRMSSEYRWHLFHRTFQAYLSTEGHTGVDSEVTAQQSICTWSAVSGIYSIVFH